MKLNIDTDNSRVTHEQNGVERELPLYSREAFEVLSDLWVKVGWDQKYSYTFSWMGRPVIQLPEDLIRTQEVIYDLRPDVIVETGVAHGGSLIFYAGLCSSHESRTRSRRRHRNTSTQSTSYRSSRDGRAYHLDRRWTQPPQKRSTEYVH